MTHVLFIRKKLIRKRGSSGQNRKKILRKSRGSISKLEILLAKNRYFFVIAFKMLKMEFKFRYTISITKM